MRWGAGLIAGMALAATLWAAAPAGAARAMPAGDFAATVGVNTHMMFHDTPYADLQATIDALRWLGIRHVRDGLSAPAPPRGTWYREDQERRYRALGRAGIRLDLMAGGPDEDGDTLAARLAIARRLPSLLALEGPNEWDINGGGDWAAELPALQRRLYDAVQADPVLQARGVKVYGPSFGRLENAAVAGDLSEFADVANLHAYTPARMPEQAEEARPPGEAIAERLRLARATGGSGPIVITETGYHNAYRQPGRMPPVTTDVAAIYTLRTVLEHARIGVRRTYLYELFDSHSDPLQISAEANFGLFTHEKAPKPAAFALRRLLRDVRSSKAPRRASLDLRLDGPEDLRSLLVARSAGRFALVLWRAAPIYDPELKQPVEVAPETVRVGLPSVFAKVRARRPAAENATTETWDDATGVDVAVDGAPVVLQLTPAKDGAKPRAVQVPLPFL